MHGPNVLLQWSAWLVTVAVTVAGANLRADEKSPAAPLNEREAAFVALMTNANLVGSFTMDKDKDKLSSESYGIRKVTKVKDNRWIVEARIVYGKNDLVVPIPVQMDWADDTAVLSVRKLSIPLLGEGFEARVLFDNGRYAGTWSHGPVGGHLFGKVEKAEPEKKSEEAAK